MRHTFIPEGSTEEIILIDEPDTPSLLQRTINFTKAIISHTFTGFQKASPEDQRIRLEICQKCDHYDKINDRCLKCGCGSLKREWKEQKCPLNLWPDPSENKE